MEALGKSGMQAKLQALEERLDPAHWTLDRDTIKCSKCGFGFYPNQPWFQDGVCIRINDFDFRPNCCPMCGKKMVLTSNNNESNPDA